MTKAEERALEAYPPTTKMFNRHAGRIQSEKVDTHAPIRRVYIKGYHQAEKDNELTWKDAAMIFVIATKLTVENTTPMTDKAFYEEVLKRFNKSRTNNN